MYAFDVGANSLARGFPKRIRDVFPAVVSGDHPEGNIDAAYFSYTHNAVFLFKGTGFWQVAGTRDRWRRPFVPRNGLLPRKEVDAHWFDICNVHPAALRLNPWRSSGQGGRSFTTCHTFTKHRVSQKVSTHRKNKGVFLHQPFLFM